MSLMVSCTFLNRDDYTFWNKLYAARYLPINEIYSWPSMTSPDELTTVVKEKFSSGYLKWLSTGCIDDIVRIVGCRCMQVAVCRTEWKPMAKGLCSAVDVDHCWSSIVWWWWCILTQWPYLNFYMTPLSLSSKYVCKLLLL